MKDEVDVQVRNLSRRGFVSFAIAAAAGFGAWKWLRSRPRVDGVAWPFRRVLEANESLAEAYFSPARLSPTFDHITKPRLNGRLGLKGEVDPSTWRLNILG